MKFREYDNLRPLTIDENSPLTLDEQIENIAKTNDIVDLQFSTHVIEGECHFCALLLIEER